MLFRAALLLVFVNGLWADRIHLVLKSPGGIDEGALASRGIKVLEALGSGEFIVSAESTSPVVRTGQPLKASSKLSDDLQASNIPIWAQVKVRGQEGVELLVYFHKDISADEAQSEMDRIGAQFVDRSDYFERLTVKLRLDDLERVAEMDWVRFIEPVFPPRKLMNNSDSRTLLKVKDAQEQYGVDGSGARVAIIDDPVATHPEFGDRLKQLQVGSGLLHGTHVAGTVGAAGSSDPRLRGMAPAVQLVSMPFATISAGISANLNSKVQQQADIGQNSWGAGVSEELGNCSLFGAYSSFDREMDRIAYQEKLSLVFAAGNERDVNGCLVRARAGYYSIPPPVAAKNLITVGAIDNTLAISEFSSFGPTRDGRLKPDVVALGVNVISTSTRNSTATLSGTSMSAPAISGLSALLVDRFRGKHGKAPAPELLRALLFNTARDLGNPGPDYSYGYGLPDAVKAIQVIENDTWNAGAITSLETKELEIDVAGGQPALRVMLAWTDLPAPAGRTRQLMNDLDLKLIGPEGQTVQPLVLNPQRPELDAQPGENTLDNSEQVVVNLPSSGRWKIVVKAKELTSSPQDYAISWTTAENPAPPCSTTVTPAEIALTDQAANVTVQVARSSSCDAWSAASIPDWAVAGDPSNPRATGTLKLKVAKNESGQQRRATMTIAGRAVVLRQNSPCATQAITSGVPISGLLTINDCLEDGESVPYYTKVYTFTAEAGQRAVISADSRQIDSFVVLYGPGNTLIAYDDDSGGSLNSRIPASGALTLPIKGTYRILMTTASPEETGSFTLTLTLEAATGDTAALPKVINSCPAEVDTELSSGASKAGRRGDLYNTDIYLFAGRLGQPIRLALSAAGFDGVLLLVSPSGATVAQEDDTDGSLPRIETLLPSNGVYRLEVSSYAPFVTGRYKLQATGCSEWSDR